MVEHVQRHRRDASGLGLNQPGPIGTVDHTTRQIEDQIEQPRPRDARDQLLDARTDARQGADFAEEWKQNRGPHQNYDTPSSGMIVGLAQSDDLHALS